MTFSSPPDRVFGQMSITGSKTVIRISCSSRTTISHAENAAPYPVFIEPGVVMLKSSDGSKQLYGRMVVDLRTGKIWGFPTITTDPYPFDALNSKPQTSHPFELGRFAFEDMDK